MRNAIITLLEIATLIGALLGGFLIFTALSPANTAIQTAASAAVGIGFVAVPYALAATFHRAMMRSKLTERVQRDDPEKGAVMEYVRAKLRGEA
ncbi:hypothetical protein SAMN06295912_108116 [Sphingomonas laterariae]|uniref:Holin-X, holin superfamily III n=1 Tax=Edaphosphingomonas laterariae TaxID=861865 RepID=A0A239FAH1_9SPHN|nr:hypothetical protein [Sphingomonas laterariae]SNS53152.1 hypothetical protein SAMN06295912_108116 [Sphingomonas laterariae]